MKAGVNQLAWCPTAPGRKSFLVPRDRRASNEHRQQRLGSNELVGSVGPSAFCTRGLPFAGDVARPSRPGSYRSRNVR